MSPIQEISADVKAQPAHLFSVRDSWWYIEKEPYGFGKYGFQGAAKFFTENPSYGTVFQVYVANDLKSVAELRKEKEAKAKTLDAFPKWQILDEELVTEASKLWILVSDTQGQLVKRISVPGKKGFQKVAWDHRRSWAIGIANQKVLDRALKAVASWEKPFAEQMAAPGLYKAQLVLELADGEVKELGAVQNFKVRRMHEPELKGKSFAEQEESVQRIRHLQKKHLWQFLPY